MGFLPFFCGYLSSLLFLFFNGFLSLLHSRPGWSFSYQVARVIFFGVFKTTDETVWRIVWKMHYGI
jgi:hypothetical protein